MAIHITTPASGQVFYARPNESINVLVAGTFVPPDEGRNLRVIVNSKWFTEDVANGNYAVTIQVTHGDPVTIEAKLNGEKKVERGGHEVWEPLNPVPITNTSIRVLLDAAPPTLRIETPVEGGTVPIRGTMDRFELRVRAQDSGSGIWPTGFNWYLDNKVEDQNTSRFFTQSMVDPALWSTFVDWPASFQVPGDHSITVRAGDKAGNWSDWVTVRFKAADVMPPTCAIERPSRDSKFSWSGAGQTTIEVAGTATDTQSGVASVSCQLLNRAGEKVEEVVQPFLRVPSGTVSWRLMVPVNTRGWYSLRCTVRDHASPPNEIIQTVEGLEVAEAFKPSDINNLLGFRQYLLDLLKFISEHFGKTQPNTDKLKPLTETDLKDVFYQEFQQLANDQKPETAGRPVNQARLCIEILREHLKSVPTNSAINVGDYARAAYETLLQQFGTSYEELRLARGSDRDTRLALAARLGIVDLDNQWSNHLDQLLLEPQAITEENLETLFGLRDSTRAPLTQPLEPSLLSWQLSQLQAMWVEQDRTLVELIVDPDVIGIDDLAHHDGPAFWLWQQRNKSISNRFIILQKLRKEKPIALDGLTAIVDSVLKDLILSITTNPDLHSIPCKNKGAKPIEFLRCLDNEQRNGTNIQPILDAIPLELSALRQLIRVLQLAESATPIVTEAEWDSICHILVRIWKGSHREAWRKEETALSISPQSFKVYRGEPPFLPHTGVKAGALLPEGKGDPQWMLIAAPGGSNFDRNVYVTQQQPKDWVANTDRSHWISPTTNASSGAAPGTYVYRTTFDLSGWDLATVQIVATVAVDDQLQAIKLNGVSSSNGVGKAGYSAFTTIVLTDNFSSDNLSDSLNVLDFVVVNMGTENNPTGLRVELSFAALPRRVQLPRWRIPATARMQWQAALQARIDQEDGLRQAFAKAIQATEELTLPLLRDTLIKKVGTVVGMAPATAADWLSERLFIETKGTGWRLTTRMQQAIETLQALVFSLRTERFTQDHPAKQWSRIKNESEDQFDEDWQMAGGYETWRAASLIFYYPENLLLPTLRQPNQITAPFRQLMQTLRARSRVTPGLARRFAMEYLDSVRGFGKLAHWPCEQGPDQTLLMDQSSNANHGKMNNAQFISDGKFGGAITFNGTTYAEVSHAGSLELGKDGADFTVSFWFRLAQDHTGSWRCIMHKGKSTYQRTFALWMVPSDNRIHFRISTNQDFNAGGNSVTQLTLNAWSHIAYVKIGTELRLYLNGKLDASAPLTGTVVGNDGSIYLGGDPWHPGILGSLDDIRIYNYALSEHMINNLADIGETTPAELNPPFTLTDQRTDEELKQLRKTAEAVLREFPKVAPPELLEIFYFVPMTLALQLQKSGEYTAALDWFQTVYAYNLPREERKIYPGLRKEANGPVALSRTEHWMREFLNPHLLATQRAYPPKDTDPRSNPYTRYTLISIARCFIEFADAEFTNDTGESLTRARSLYLTARRILADSDLDQVQPTKNEETLLPNPILDALRKRIDTQLTKMQQGRNIAGMKREIEVPTPPKTLVGLPTIGSGGQLVIPGARRRQKPTPYRFTVLMERAKQLVGIAQQIEATYLSALEKRDSENYNLKRAGFDLQLAEAGNTLQTLRETEAMDSEALVIQQKAKAAKQKETYRKWIDNGLSATEEAIIGNYITAGSAQIASIWFSVGLAVAQAQAAASPATTTAPVGVAAVTATGVLSALKSGADSVAIGAKAAAEVLSIKASHERRVNDWQLAYDLADIEEKIADQQAIVARDHTNIVRQEKAIAQLQTTQAAAMAHYLANKFTNAELYEWMSGVLAGVYSYFLQQATGIALLAESQLTFERQEAPTSFIQNDYWDAPSDGATPTPGGKGTDRRGLTGSARLLQDIYQLDQFAFEANKRKLNLTHTLSLATLDPYAFAVFRDTGVLNFQTPMRIFDEAFPGQYLRLIKRVRTSVVALIPPVVGIRANLTASGVSRVVIGGDVFQETTIRRDPELVALSSPVNATGVFELDAQSELLLPFESMGVDTRWEFSMPRASNPFDFTTIADVLVTIEYTALYSDDYRRQVIQELDLRVSADKAFSVRTDFPDIWYELVNPGQGTPASTIRFRTERSHFPPNLEENIVVGELLFAVLSRNDELDLDKELVKMSYTPDLPKGSDAVKGDAAILERRIHTRRSGASSWGMVQGKHATGAWEFVLPASVLTPIRKGEIDDILVVITFKGTKPSWPT